MSRVRSTSYATSYAVKIPFKISHLLLFLLQREVSIASKASVPIVPWTKITRKRWLTGELDSEGTIHLTLLEWDSGVGAKGALRSRNKA